MAKRKDSTGPAPGEVKIPPPEMGKMNKTLCRITREQFATEAAPVQLVIGGQNMTADPREFSSGSIGWYANGKLVLKVGDQPVTVQVGVNLTIVGSKDLPPAAPSA